MDEIGVRRGDAAMLQARQQLQGEAMQTGSPTTASPS